MQFYLYLFHEVSFELYALDDRLIFWIYVLILKLILIQVSEWVYNYILGKKSIRTIFYKFVRLSRAKYVRFALFILSSITRFGN